MTTDHEATRAQARRAQILEAASECFRAHGFHAASISQICKTAGMSPGHVYHYFENKEAIIAALIERDLEQTLTIGAEMRSAQDVLQGIIETVSEGVARCTDPHDAGLRLEIVAEASRNPGVAEILRRAERTWDADLMEIIKAQRRTFGLPDDDVYVASLIDAFSAMFDGLRILCIVAPDCDRAALSRIYQRIIRELLTTEPDYDTSRTD